MEVEIHLMHAEIRVGVECLGHGFVTGVPLAHGERYITLEVPVTRQALDHLEAIAPETRIDLELKLTGWLHARDNNEDGPRFTNSPQPGEWVFQSFGEANQALLPFQVARSDWFTHVLQPIGTVEYISTEIVLPSGDPLLRAAVNQIREAQNAYSMHNDPAVFLYCRGAIDALPGAKQEIFASLTDPDEAKLLDDLTLYVGQYLHRGRHVAADGEELGEFPVDHTDAAFALNLTKVLIAHISHVLNS
jgi:hypothetical protein